MMLIMCHSLEDVLCRKSMITHIGWRGYWTTGYSGMACSWLYIQPSLPASPPCSTASLHLHCFILAQYWHTAPRAYTWSRAGGGASIQSATIVLHAWLPATRLTRPWPIDILHHTCSQHHHNLNHKCILASLFTGCGHFFTVFFIWLSDTIVWVKSSSDWCREWFHNKERARGTSKDTRDNDDDYITCCTWITVTWI